MNSPIEPHQSIHFQSVSFIRSQVTPAGSYGKITLVSIGSANLKLRGELGDDWTVALAVILNLAHGTPQLMTSARHLLSAREIATQIRRKEVSPVEVARAHVDCIERLNPKLNAFVDYKPEAVLAQAREAEKALMHSNRLDDKDDLGRLHGVPLSIKSSIHVAGHLCEAGSRLRVGYVAAEDAPLVGRLRAAGAVILGVTNTPELLMAWETDNLLYGRTNNPWDLSRTAGGSSGGEAAAIAAGLSAGGVGSDGGGSVRVPAHFCGICGLKPTPGRIPSTGHFPKAGGPFALLGVVGPMARTVADLHLLFEVMAGADDGDPASAPVELHAIDEAHLLATSIGFFEDDGRTPVTEETRQAVRHTALLLMSCRFHVDAFRPDGLEEARQLWWDFFGTAGGMILEPMLLGHESELSPILREFRAWTQAAPAHTGESLLAAWLERDSVREKFLMQMRKYRVLICPVAAVPAFRHGERQWQVDGSTVKYLEAWSYCEWFNLLGFPAVVVPMGYSKVGLPIGVQIVGRPWEEELLLAVAEKLEQERGPWQSPALE
jgi:Asp-tRNA(Asn)/Glu-tRNA(Gln) amidotransferase A subunit family amidase